MTKQKLLKIKLRCIKAGVYAAAKYLETHTAIYSSRPPYHLVMKTHNRSLDRMTMAKAMRKISIKRIMLLEKDSGRL